jgi:formylglycine-generating enzyme required for sulfatase activity
MPFPLLRCLARAIAKQGPRLLLDVAPWAGRLYDVAVEAWEDYRRDQREDALQAEVQALAQATPEQVRQEVEEAVGAEADGQPPEVRRALTAYLAQVPAAIRRSLRRPSDPRGATLPATRSLRRPEDLLPFLPPRPPRFQPGDSPLPGVDWVLEELVGVGGFGEVWKARHAHLKSKAPVALKFCLDEEAVPALRNEVGVLDRVMQDGRHPGIVPLLQTYLGADPPCLEYEFVEGGDLAGLIQDLHARGEMTAGAANRLFLQLVEVVASAHTLDPPIVHDDLKPSNVLVRQDEGGELRLFVTDFGIGGLATARAAQETHQPTRGRQELLTEAVRGAYTPLYASPEQMARRKGEPADPRDDVHALGVIWYQLLTGDLGMLSVPPDWREQVQERGLDDRLVPLLASCIASRAQKRPASAAVPAERLRALLSPAEAPPLKEPLAAKSAPARRRARGAQAADPPPQPSEPAKATRLPGEVIGNSLGMRFAWCPPGTFLMGSPPTEKGRSDDETQHQVTLTGGFWLGVYPVTQAQWREVMGDQASHFKGADLPVEMVSWEDCQAFCQKLTARDGQRYRLPTEAEWEYACRAGTTTPFSFGATINSDLANYNGTIAYGRGKKGVYRQQTTLVDSFPPNAWGLCDMHGNVWEWCADGYGPYPARYVTDLQGVQGADRRVLRGGSWLNGPDGCRSAARGRSAPVFWSNRCGFRVVLGLD